MVNLAASGRAMSRQYCMIWMHIVAAACERNPLAGWTPGGCVKPDVLGLPAGATRHVMGSDNGNEEQAPKDEHL